MRHQNKNKMVKLILCIMVMAMSVFGLGQEAYAADRSLNLEAPTQDEIRQYVKNHTRTSQTETTYASNPVTTSPYAAGVLSDETLQYALDALNEMRYIAGIYSK